MPTSKGPGFALLLFQDPATIPVLAVIPILAAAAFPAGRAHNGAT